VLISAAFPPLPVPPGLSAGELCTREPIGRLGSMGLDPTGIATAVTGGISAVGGIFQTLAAEKIAKKQAKVQEAQIKAEREQNARDFAIAQAQMLALPAEQSRLAQTYALWAVGGVAVFIGGIFLIAAIRAKGK